MGRKPCCTNEGLNKGAWTSHEDKLLSDYIAVHGHGKWRALPKKAGLKRCGKSCRLRWLNYLRPDIKRGNITEEEEDLIIRLHKLLGNRWSLIAGRLPGRTDNEIKNYWNTNLKKKLFSDCSEQQTRLSKNMKPSARKPPKGRGQEEASNVIRTKAVRCSRLVFPDSAVNACNWPINNGDFLKDLITPSLPLDVATNDNITREEYLLMQVSRDDFYTSNDAYFAPPSEGNKYREGTSTGCEMEGEGVSCFFDGDVWDSFML